MMRGALLALIEPKPRMRMADEFPVGSPLEEIICTPEVVPASALVTFVAIFFSMVSSFTIAAEPVNELLLAVP